MAKTLKAKPAKGKSKAEHKNSLGLLPLTGLVVGSIIGGGIFNLMSNTASTSALVAVIIGWLITGFGMLMLALCFQNLSNKRPDLQAGIFSYAKEGFGNFFGFNAAWGYWFSAWLGNVAYATLTFSSVGYFLKTFGNGENTASIIGGSVLLWLVHFLILRGIKTASFMNTIVTLAKLIPIAIFILAAFTAFKLHIFTSDIWGNASNSFVWKDLMTQVRGMMLTTVWVFIGIEGAVIFSGRAKRSRDVARATMLGLATVTAVYLLITVLSIGLMKQGELAQLSQPAMAELLKSVVGSWGAGLVNVGLIVSVTGAWIAWTMFAAELPYRAAKQHAFPAVFARENSRGVPVVALTVTNILVQLFLLTFLTKFTVKGVSFYTFAFSLASSAILIPYLFSALYQLKHSLREKRSVAGRTRNIVIGIFASLYGLWLIYAGGIDYLLLTMLLYVPGVVVYVLMQLRNRQKVFTLVEAVFMLLILGVGFVGLQRLLSGAIQL